MRSDLNWIEGLLYRLITAPSGVAEGLARETSLGPGGLAEVIAPDQRLSAEDRVGIYANMYFYRLRDVLSEDFPVTLKLLGPEHFHNVVTGYLVEYPPDRFSVLYAGRFLADYLSGHWLREQFPFIGDLARLERSLIDVFHAADAQPLAIEAMRSIAPADWPGLRMRMHPAAAILDLEWRVTELARAAQEGCGPVAAAREECCALVWRNRNRVHYREIGRAEREALTLASRGATFSEICEAIAASIEAAEPAAEIHRRFEGWLRDGLLVRE